MTSKPPQNLPETDDRDYIEVLEAAIEKLEAEVERLKRLTATYVADAGANIDKLEAEVERLQAIVDKLPKTADGVPVVPGMNCYFRSHPLGMIHKDAGIVSVGRSRDGESYEVFLRDDNGDEWWAILPEEVFSTREAAEEAGE